MIFPETEIQYRPGRSFKCFRPVVSPDGDRAGEECGTEIVMHGYHWCAQVCPDCLANYWVSGASKRLIGFDPGAFYPTDTAKLVRETIAANGGQYVPRF